MPGAPLRSGLKRNPEFIAIVHKPQSYEYLVPTMTQHHVTVRRRTLALALPLIIVYLGFGTAVDAFIGLHAPSRAYCGDLPLILLSALPDEQQHNDGSHESSSIPQYRSRSTAQPDADSEFAIGSEARQERLDKALEDLGFDPSTLTDDPQFRGSSALRMYNSFVNAPAELPQRASVIANSIAFKARELRSHQEEWLRNHDKSLAEVDKDQMPRYPLTIVLDNIRSAHNVGNILRLAEAARITKVVLCGITPSPPNPSIEKKQH